MTAGSRSVTVTDTITGSITGSQTVSISVGALSSSTSTLVASPAIVPADGNTTTQLTVTAKDAYGNLISGQSVTLSASGGNNTFTPASGSTNGSGVFLATLASQSVGTQTVTATLGSVMLNASVTFFYATLAFAPANNVAVGRSPWTSPPPTSTAMASPISWQKPVQRHCQRLAQPR